MSFRNIISRPLFIAASIAVIVIAAAVVTILSLTGSAPGTDTASANVVILLDRSIAMGEPFDGKTKLEAAIEVITEDILDKQVADLQNLAFRQYGGACVGDNSELVVTFGQNNKDSVQDALGGIAIDGETTLVGGLTEIPGDFSGLVIPEGTLNRVIIVAGAGDSCEADLVAALTRLRTMGIAVDFIGLDIPADQLEPLRRAANAAGAGFIFVKTRSELASELTTAISQLRAPLATADGTSLTAPPTVLAAVQRLAVVSSEPPVAIIQTTITATREEVDLLPGVLVQATGNLGLQPAAGLATEIVAGELPGASLKVAMLVTNAPPGRVFVGDINFTLGNLQVTTVEGRTLVSITLDQAAGLSITGGAMLIGTAGGGIDLNIEDPKLVLQLSARDISDLRGGSATVSQIGGNLVLDIKNLPDGASLEVTFAKDPSVFINDQAAKFSLLAENINRTTGNLADDVAFVLNVKKTGISNDDLGDTQITLEVSQQWFDEKRALDLAILFAKFDDDGNPVLPALDVTDSCASTGNGTVACKGNFTGAQGGLSTFGEFAGGTGTGY